MNNVLSASEFLAQGWTSGRVRSLANTMERLSETYMRNDPQRNVNLQNARTLRARAKEMDRLPKNDNQVIDDNVRRSIFGV